MQILLIKCECMVLLKKHIWRGTSTSVPACLEARDRLRLVFLSGFRRNVHQSRTGLLYEEALTWALTLSFLSSLPVWHSPVQGAQ